MKWKQPIQHIPDGAPVSGMSAALRRISDGTTVQVLPSDQDGYLTVQRDGHLEPVYLHLQDAPGGDKLSRSDETHMVGPTCPAEWPVALMALGDGVIRGSGGGGELECMMTHLSYTVKPGAAVVYGHPVVFYTGLVNSPLGRPNVGTYTYRVIVRLYPTGSSTTPGKADLALTGPTVNTNVPPPLVQTTEVWEMALGTIIMPASGDPTCLDERDILGDAITVTAAVKPPSTFTSTGGAGVDIPQSTFTLKLTEPTLHTITARISGEQYGATQVWAQTQQAGLGAYNQLSIAATPNGGWIYVADYNRQLVMRFDSAGNYYGAVGGLPYCRGICADSNYVYVAFRANSGNPRIHKYGHDLAGPYVVMSMPDTGYPYSLTTDGSTYLYCGTSVNKVYRVYSSNGNVNGELSFTDPQGITFRPFPDTDGQYYLYIVSRSNKSIWKFRAYDFAYAYNFGGFTDPLGLEVDANGWLVVADLGAGLVRRVTNGGGVVDSFATAGCIDVSVVPGDVIWVLDYSNALIRKFDQTVPGYGSLAIDIDGAVSSYLGLGNRNGAFSNAAAVANKQGPGTVTIKGKMRADTGTFNLQGLSLSAVAVPQD